jgi:hypothetical protein
MVQTTSFIVTNMAMKTRTASLKAALLRRIRQFYRLVNERRFDRCRQMIDPRVLLNPSSVTLLQYENALREFIDKVGSVKVRGIKAEVHIGEPSKLYEDRDFAVGKTTWQDAAGEEHIFLERWVREGRVWYTRSTGFVVPRTGADASLATHHETGLVSQARQSLTQSRKPASAGRGG